MKALKDVLAPALDCVCANLRAAARTTAQIYNAALAPVGLTIGQFNVMVGLAFLGPVTVGGLAKVLVMDPTTVNRNLKPMERRGLVEIVPGEDRRTRMINLTEDGDALVRTAFPLWRQAHADILARTDGNAWTALRPHVQALASLTVEDQD